MDFKKSRMAKSIKNKKIKYEIKDLELHSEKRRWFAEMLRRNESDKDIIKSLCSHIIDILEPLSIPQKAFALHSLIHSFEDVSGIKTTAIIDSKCFAPQEDSE